jgi:transposase InsO family protein
VRAHRNAILSFQARRLLVERIREDGWTVIDAADAAGCSERTAYKWLARFDAEGEAGLEDRSSAPKTSPTRTAQGLVDAIEQLRRQNRWSGPRIAEQLALCLSTVTVVLARLGLNRLSKLDPPEPPNRYERRHPGELVHIDTKKLGRFDRPGHRVTGDRRGRNRRAGWEHVHVCVDDHSRLAFIEVRETDDADDAAAFLEAAIGFYRDHGVRVRRVMTDNALAYRRSKAWRRVCHRHRIKHITTKPYRPRTNGKAERFVRIMLNEWAYTRPYPSSTQRRAALRPWIDFYNHRRPHGSLERQPPISRIPTAA